MDHLSEQLKLQKQIRELEKKNKQLEYDLSRADYLLGESILIFDQIKKRADCSGDSFTAVWCDSIITEIKKSLDLPRFGIDVITWNEIREDKDE
jgi:hypothetical protein